ncbi:MAG: hypothetical protein GX220_02125 [Treponema sp.]|nr:hypothetical protein [Treponema sp.]
MPAAQIIISIIPIVGIVFGFIIIFFYLLWKHRQISLQIKTGTFHQVKYNIHMFSLLAGILLTNIGSVLTILFALIEGISYTLLGGLIPLVCGISLLIFQKLYPKNKD